MKHRAFSLIEIIIAVAIVALISAAAVLGFGQQRASSRDARRISDTSTIGTAIENFDSVQTGGIFDPGGGYVNASSMAPLVAGGYLNNVPSDPKPAGAIYGSWGQCASYYVNSPRDGTTDHAWILTFTAEIAPNTSSVTDSGDLLYNTLGYSWGTHTLNSTVKESANSGCGNTTRYLSLIMGHKLDANRQ